MSTEALDSIQLSSGERHLIARVRAGLTQKEAADGQRPGVSLWQYRRSEKDLDASKAPRVEPLAEHEIYLIKRTRARITRRSMAKRMKISEYWLYRMERGTAPIDKLRAHWSGR